MIQINETTTLYNGDMLEILDTLPENSIDTCITDPPYHLTSIVKRFGKKGSAPAQYGTDGVFARASAGFLQKTWDGGDIAFRPETWAKVYRVLKPGAYCLAFGGDRTYHRLACAVEDAGFEIYGCAVWATGQGFPKAHRVDLNASRCLPEGDYCQCDANTRSSENTFPLRNVLDHIRSLGLSFDSAYGVQPSVLDDLDIPEDFLDDYQFYPRLYDEPLRRAANDVLTFSLLLKYVQEYNHFSLLSDVRVSESLHSLCLALCNDLPSMLDYLNPSFLQHALQLLQECEDKQFPLSDLSMSVSRLAGSLNVRAFLDADKSVFRKLHIHSLVFCLPLSFSRILCSKKYDTIIPQIMYCQQCGKVYNITAGWRSALKPAIELIVIAQKPRDGSYENNFAKWGVAGFNIDGARIPTDEVIPINKLEQWSGFGQKERPDYKQETNTEGRYPANLIHDGSDEVVGLFPQSSGGAFPKKSNVPSGAHYEGGWGKVDNEKRIEMGDGSAARFFYCAKPSKAERNEGLEDMDERLFGQSGGAQGVLSKGGEEYKQNSIGLNRIKKVKNHHPTVKPLSLLEHLVTLTKTPTGGTVLDPFMGSGTTGCACALQGRKFIGVELEEEYFEIARRRIEYMNINRKGGCFDLPIDADSEDMVDSE